MKEAFAIFFLISLVVFAIWSFGTVVKHYSCHAKWQDTFETRYGPFRGCQIKVNGQWIPSVNYRVL